MSGSQKMIELSYEQRVYLVRLLAHVEEFKRQMDQNRKHPFGEGVEIITIKDTPYNLFNIQLQIQTMLLSNRYPIQAKDCLNQYKYLYRYIKIKLRNR